MQCLINPTFSKLVKQFSNKKQVSSYRVWLSIYLVLLHQMTNQTDLTIEIPINIRSRDNKEKYVFGYFVNTVPLRMKISTNETFSELVQKVNDYVQEVITHQNYPLNHLITNMDKKQEVNKKALCSTAFNILNLPRFRMKNLETKVITHQKRVSNSDMVWRLVQNQEDVLNLEIDFNSSKYTEKDIQKLVDRFQYILKILIGNSEIPLCDVEFLLPQDNSVYQRLNDTDVLLPPYQSIQKKFYEQAHTRPEAVAISTEDKTYTYKEINEYSNQIADYLLSAGIQVQEPVAILFDRSVESILCMIGIVKAGGTYVPIDVTYPSERIKYILEDSEIAHIVTMEAFKEKWMEPYAEVATLETIFSSFSRKDIDNKNTIEDIAYIIYTSGSTGRPKGTPIRHKGILNLINWRSHTNHLSNQDIIAQYASHSFDASVAEIFSALLNGARLHLLTDEQRLSVNAYFQAIYTHGITVSDVPTAFFNQLAREISSNHCYKLKSLRRLMIGGEAASTEMLRKWQAVMKNEVVIINEYGPTETTVVSLANCISTVIPPDIKHIPIGKPIFNTKIYILNDDMKRCPIGVIGELYLESVGTAIGYIKQAERTKASFIRNPFSDNNNSVLYRTGDLVCLSHEGIVEYIGRKDRQVKIRGYRIELNEIENVLEKEPRIQQAVVLPDEKGAELHAYFITHDKATIDIEEVYNHASSLLPEYMVPKGYVCVNKIPITLNGKIDVLKLMQQNAVQYRKQQHSLRPITETQILLANVWEEVLEVQNIGLQDDFFALGGHSLKIMPTLVKLKPYFPTLHIQDFFHYRTIEKLAVKIEKDRQQHKTIETKQNEQNSSENHCIQQPTPTRKQPIPLQISKKYPRCVLLTGVTGFLGAHIFQQLLCLPNTIVYCLARSQKSASVEKRIIEKMQFYFGESILEQWGHRVRVIEGDLSKEYVGLTTEMQEHLVSKIDTIIHCGGDVRHYGDREHFEKVNVESTRYLLQMSKKAGARFHYISTVSIAGHHSDDPAEVLFSEQDFDRGQQIENVYVESKFLAEKLVREAMDEGVSATVYRVGNLVGHTRDGKFQQNIEGNAFYRLTKALLLLQKAPDIPTKIDLVPINFGSAAIIGLACTEQSKGETFHICNPVQLDWKQFITHLQQTGYSIEVIPGAEFMNLFTNQQLSEDQIYALEMLIPVLEETDKKAEAIITCQHTERFLHTLNIICENPNQEWISKLISYGETIEFFPKKVLHYSPINR